MQNPDIDLSRKLYRIQAQITAAMDRDHAWQIIQDAPESMRQMLINHAQTVFSIRRFHERQKRKSKAGGKNEY